MAEFRGMPDSLTLAVPSRRNEPLPRMTPQLSSQRLQTVRAQHQPPMLKRKSPGLSQVDAATKDITNDTELKPDFEPVVDIAAKWRVVAIREAHWVKMYRKAFPKFRFYFDGVEKEVKDKVTKQILSLGGSIETFFSTKCTHLITTCPVPGSRSSYADENMLPTGSASTTFRASNFRGTAFSPITPASSTHRAPLSCRLTPAPDRLLGRYHQPQDRTPGSAASALLTPAQSPAGEGCSMWESFRTKFTTLSCQIKSLGEANTEVLGKEDIIDKAQRLKIKIWSLEKLQNKILKRLFDSAEISPPTPDLPQLLHTEKLFGLSTSLAVGGSFTPHPDFYYFHGYYFLVEVTTGKHCPIYAYEYHIIKGHEVPWPRLRKTCGRGSPFVMDYKKGKDGNERGSRAEEGRADEEKVEEGRDKTGEERGEEGRAEEGQGEKSALVQDREETAENPPMQEQYVVMKRLDEVQANTPVFVRSMASGIQASIDSRAVSSARSNAQVKYVPRDPRLEIMGKRVMVASGKEIGYKVSMNREEGRRRKDEEVQWRQKRKEREERGEGDKEKWRDLELQGLKRKEGERERKRGKWRNEERERDEKKEKVSEFHQEQNKRKRESEEEEGGEGNEEESRDENVQKQRRKEGGRGGDEGGDEGMGEERDDETKEEGKVQRKDEKEVRLTKSSKMARPGNCENCWVKFKDLDTHMQSPTHRGFATDSENYFNLDILLGQVKRCGLGPPPSAPTGDSTAIAPRSPIPCVVFEQPRLSGEEWAHKQRSERERENERTMWDQNSRYCPNWSGSPHHHRRRRDGIASMRG